VNVTLGQLLLADDGAGPRPAATSPSVTPAAEEAALRAAAYYGRPAAPALFVADLTREAVGVFRTTPGAFHALAVPRFAYEAVGDPFALADRFPPTWSARGDLPDLELPPELPPRRTVAAVLEAFQAGDMPWLLGGTQALLDGARLIVAADAPDEARLRQLWVLLPTRTRAELRPATLTPSLDAATALGIHVAVVPGAAELPPNVLGLDQTRDYPEGRYELALQVAVETNDQADLDRLFARRTSAETLRLALTAVALATAVAVIVKVAV
jgi:hypothetical protein